MFAWPSTGEPKVITAAISTARSDGFAFTPDSRTVYLLAEERGHEKLFTVPAAGGEARLAFDMTQGVLHRAGDSGEGRRAAPDRQLGKRRQPGRSGAHRPARQGGTAAYRSSTPSAAAAHRLAAAAALLVHQHARQAHPQHDRAAAGVRREQEVPAAGADARRPAQHVARPVLRCAGTTTCWRAPGYVRAADQLHRLDRIRREVRAGDPGRPVHRARRTRSTRRRTRRSGGSRSSTARARRRPAPATAATWPTGCRPPPRATSAWSATPA